MKKIGQVSIFIVIAIILVGNVILITLLRDKTETTSDIPECQTNEQCTGASLCHPTTCVQLSQAPIPDPENPIICTEDCQPGTLDCPEQPGQLICKCINTKCEAVPA